MVTARSLAGQELLDPSGKDLGTVRYVLVRVGTGDFRGVAVREEDSSTDGLVFVPSKDLEISVIEDELRTRVAAEQLRKAPHFTQEELASLTQPTTWTTVDEYWAPLRVDVASAPPGDASGANADAAPDAAGVDATEGAAGEDAREGADGAEEAIAHVLVGRTIVTTLADPEVNFAEQIVGADVHARSGERVGEIDDVALDPEANRVAYAVIIAGGFLGIGSEWYAVPMESLLWTAEEKRLRFEGDVARLKEYKSLDASRAPMRIHRSDQAKLYDHFGVEPYWTPTAAR